MEKTKIDLCETIKEDFYREGFGNTPMLKYDLDNGSTVFAKLEWYNPFGSIKDRGAFFMVDDLIHTVSDIKQKIIVEGTSGNTGIATGNICRKLGLKSRLYIPPGTSQGTLDELLNSGAEVIKTNESKDITSTEKSISIALDLSIMEPEKFIFLHQHGNDMNLLSHIYTTGPESESQMGGLPDAVAISMGTGGSIIGNGKYFKSRDKGIKLFMLQSDQNSYIQGVRNFLRAKDKSIIEKNISIVDKMFNVNEKDATDGVRTLAQQCNVFVGFSSGANFTGALRIAQSHDNYKVFTVFPDSGMKYIQFYKSRGILDDGIMNELIPNVKKIQKSFILLK
jgi:cysteine synthase